MLHETVVAGVAMIVKDSRPIRNHDVSAAESRMWNQMNRPISKVRISLKKNVSQDMTGAAGKK